MPFIDIDVSRLEYEWIRAYRASTPPIVMLHEGLGSVAMWKEFPRELSAATGRDVLAYSRHGHGRSSMLAAPHMPDYMHREALTVLPCLLDTLGVEAPILLGHSDGASIALIHAGGTARAVTALVLLAPHVFIEELSIESIAAAKLAFATTDLRKRLARYHDDVDSTFRGWNDIWLHPDFRRWNVERYLPRIACPILVIQGRDDEYGTTEQLERIARGARNVEILVLENCGHAPHRDQPQAVLDAAVRFTVRMTGMPRAAGTGRG